MRDWNKDDFIEEIRIVYPNASDKIKDLSLSDLGMLYQDLSSQEQYHRRKDYYNQELANTVNEYIKEARQ